MIQTKVVLLNALVTSSRTPLTLKTKPVSIEEVKAIIANKEIISYIGHEATAQLLSLIFNRTVPTNRSMYDPRPGDLAVVVKLRKRLEKPEDVKNLTVNDIEFILVEYHEY
jgi:hypothetical protein